MLTPKHPSAVFPSICRKLWLTEREGLSAKEVMYTLSLLKKSELAENGVK